MRDKSITDQQQRDQALDPTSSFIVQAPAGSGKTGLLTQRYLTLLAGVSAPEEIIALTFTRKAASQMRTRILSALQDAKENKKAETDYQGETLALAAKVLRQDSDNDWCLLDAPRRLRIQTIDSFIAGLNRQMPVLSGFGSAPRIVDNAEVLYRQAARATIAEVESGEQWSPAIECLIYHLDNRLSILEDLIINMLHRRDHWLRHIANKNNPQTEREQLESCLQNAIQHGLLNLKKCFPSELVDECLQLVRYAAENIKNNKPDAVIADIQGIDTLPGTKAGDLPTWNSILNLLLTADKDINKVDWRKRVDVRNGFPKAEKKDSPDIQELRNSMKLRHRELIDQLSIVPGLLDVMRLIRLLPNPVYDEEQWRVLSSLFELLRIAEAQLRVVFRDTGQVDHTAMTQGALQALGDMESPTELALSLDYRIQHILIDEFQDTSLSQYELIEHLTAGWQPGDGRSLFLVGDPMQSIYRFREAEVGLYLKAMHEGFSAIKPKVLTLSVNFRSQEKIIDWVNRAFPVIMPAEEDIANGAIPFAASAAYHEALKGEAVSVHPFAEKNYEDEAGKVIELIQESRNKTPDSSVAVLVRNRSHLFHIAEMLKREGLPFQAIEIERLSHRPVIQDLLSLVFALSHLADRISWLSILRAPWCGLTLDDLHRLAGVQYGKTIWSCIEADEHIATLGNNGQDRIRALRSVIRERLSLYRRMSLRSFIEGTWLLLGGPACLDDETDLEDAKAFFELLQQHDRGGALTDRRQLSKDVDSLFALADINADKLLQLMTIHKAKGLEFDTVIVPGLGREPKAQSNRLLMWMERPQAKGGNDLLLAPIREYGSEHDRTYDYLKHLDQQKDGYESTRLLYVAATRAKQRLHLLGCVKSNESKQADIKSPNKRSLLYPLWPVVSEAFRQLLETREDASDIDLDIGNDTRGQKLFQRLVDGWQLPQPHKTEINIEQQDVYDENEPEENIEYSWAGEAARHIGNAVHRLLQYYSNEDGMSSVTSNTYIRRLLLQSGIAAGDLESALAKVKKIVDIISNDERGQWILSKTHSDIHNEYALSGICARQLVRVVLDRTFVDSDGIRWIIDYKTGTHSGSKVDEFLDREQERYQQQLEDYAALMSLKEDRSIRLGLYYPAIPGWREWSYDP